MWLQASNTWIWAAEEIVNSYGQALVSSFQKVFDQLLEL